MALQIIRYRKDDQIHWGVHRQGRVSTIPGRSATTGDFLRAHSLEALTACTADDLSLDQVDVLSPVTTNQQFICQGANYRSHMLESGMDPDAKRYNMLFRKASSCIVPASSDVVRPPGVALLDYEVELGIVLGRDIEAPRTVTDGALQDVLAGLVVVNDYSARDVQIPQMQFYKGKSYRTFGPVGPFLCLLEAGDWQRLEDLELRLTVNGAERQAAMTSEMIFSPAETLTELSQLQDLHVGDLIATGTPAGCALRLPPPLVQRASGLLPDPLRFKLFAAGQRRRSAYLQPGDLVCASIRSRDGALDLGTQRNRIV